MDEVGNGSGDGGRIWPLPCLIKSNTPSATAALAQASLASSWVTHIGSIMYTRSTCEESWIWRAKPCSASQVNKCRTEKECYKLHGNFGSVKAAQRGVTFAVRHWAQHFSMAPTQKDSSPLCLGGDGPTSLGGVDNDVSPNAMKFTAPMSTAILDASVLASTFLENTGCVA